MHLPYLLILLAHLICLATARKESSTTSETSTSLWYEPLISTVPENPTKFDINSPQFEISNLEVDEDVDIEFSSREGIFPGLEGSYRKLVTRRRGQCVNLYDWGFYHNMTAHSTRFIRNVCPDNATCYFYNVKNCGVDFSPASGYISSPNGAPDLKFTYNMFIDPITQTPLANKDEQVFYPQDGWLEMDTELEEGRRFYVESRTWTRVFGQGRIASARCTAGQKEREEMVRVYNESMRVLQSAFDEEQRRKTETTWVWWSTSVGGAGGGGASTMGLADDLGFDCLDDPEYCGDGGSR